MKCPYCNGKGYYEIGSSYGTEKVKCHCQREQTNEEYLKQASTEELAEVLFTAYDDGVVSGEWSACGNGCCRGNGGEMLVKEDFEEWLKQPYKGVK